MVNSLSKKQKIDILRCVCQLALASFAKRLYDQQGLKGAYYLVKAGWQSWSKRLQKEGLTIDCVELGVWSKQVSVDGILT